MELAGQTAMLAGKRGLCRQAEGGKHQGRLKTESQRKRGGRGDCGAAGLGPTRPWRLCWSGGRVEAGDRPLGNSLAPLRREEALVHRPVPPAVSGQRGLTAPLAFLVGKRAGVALHRDPED